MDAPTLFRPLLPADVLARLKGEDAAPYAAQLDQIAKWIEAVCCNLVVHEAEYVDRAFLTLYRSQYASSFSPQAKRCDRYIFLRLPEDELDTCLQRTGVALVDHINSCCLTNSATRNDGRPILGAVGALVRRPITRWFGRSYFRVDSTVAASLLGPGQLESITMTKPISLAGRPFMIDSCVPFTSQDGYAAACASVATWTSLELAAQGREVSLTPTGVTNAARTSTQAHDVFARGLGPSEMIVAIRRYGYAPVVCAPQNRSTWHVALSLLLDSSIAPVVGLTLLPSRDRAATKHAITVTGLIKRDSVEDLKKTRWGDEKRAFWAIDDGAGPFVRLDFLDGDARQFIEQKHSRLFSEMRLDASGLVELTWPNAHSEHKRLGVIDLLLGAAPHAIEPIRQHVVQEAPDSSLRAACVLLASYRALADKTRPEEDRDNIRRVEAMVGEMLAEAFTERQYSLAQRIGDDPSIAAWADELYRFAPRLVNVCDESRYLEANYQWRTYLVRSTEYKRWLAECPCDRQQVLAPFVRDRQLPEYVFLLELTRKRRKTSCSCANQRAFGSHIHGEVLTDPTEPHGRLLYAWLEDFAILPSDNTASLSVSASLTAAPIPVEYPAFPPNYCVPSWSSNPRRGDRR